MSNRKELLEYVDKHSEKRNRNLKYDFMPSLLEIIERPSHAAGRVIIWTVFALFVFAIFWATIAKVEINIDASGSLEPDVTPEVITAGTDYKVTAINVEVGQTVKKDEVLINMSSKDTEEDFSKVNEEVTGQTQLYDLYERVLNGEDISETDVSAFGADVKNQAEKIIEEHKEYLKNPDIYTDYMDQVRSSSDSQKKNIDEVTKERDKLQKLIDESSVKAPYDGVVYNIYVNNDQMYIAKDQPVISVIPADYKLEMKCYVKDTDIGDIELGQAVNIKLAAYPYSDYGTVDGKVCFIGEKATNMEKLGKVVVVKVKITDKKFKEKLMPGLSATADIVIGKRRVIDYFIDPITGALNNSIKEK